LCRRGGVVVETTLGHLSLPAHQEPGGLDRRQPAARRANLLCDLLRDRDISRVEVDVERDQEGPRADRRHPSRRMDMPWPEVRICGRICADPVAQTLDLTLADVG